MGGMFLLAEWMTQDAQGLELLPQDILPALGRNVLLELAVEHRLVEDDHRQVEDDREQDEGGEALDENGEEAAYRPQEAALRADRARRVRAGGRRERGGLAPFGAAVLLLFALAPGAAILGSLTGRGGHHR